ncbi:Bbp16 family capsid cement protein [Achromobacter insolitus]|uniref:Bbp16 family capsid cement protein n=1 Tax=Achromobacter insolitus TaxID=217204 RepID=UPI0020A52D7F|nr:hypothetical protein [Achromobacter insolitus]MCP1404429.1 hypothetical protein [Achromobacter insolitus]
MYIDSRLEFSNKQVVAAAGPSTNVVDLGTPARKIGPGRAMWVVVQVDAIPAAAVTATIQTSEAEGFGTSSNIGSVTIPQDTPVGTRFVIGFPYTNQRYLRMNYSAAGTLSAWLTDQEPQSWEAYPAQT